MPSRGTREAQRRTQPNPCRGPTLAGPWGLTRATAGSLSSLRATASASSSLRSAAITAATASPSDTSRAVEPAMNIFVSRKLPSSVIAKLETAGHVEVYAGNGAITPDGLRQAVVGKQALVTMLTEQVDAALLDAGKDLKVVANVAVGYNNIDVAAARSRGVIVTNTPDVLTESVADFTWALILAVTRRLSEGERVVRRGEWKGWAFDFMLGTELGGKQLGLVGLGRIGRAVAKKASAFG